jgi:hypothetical protein
MEAWLSFHHNSKKGKYMIFVAQYRWKKNEKVSGGVML